MTDSTMVGRDLRRDAPDPRPRSLSEANASTYGAASTLSASAVSWAAIIAGAAGAAALSLILLILGTGLGLSAVSPFSGQGVGATAFGASTIAWLTFTQLAASGLGGYLAGRLRSRWISTHTDEVYFRDTAHGFLAWALATLVTAGLLGTAIGNIVGAGANVAGGVAGTPGTAAVVAAGSATAGAAKAGSVSTDNSYFVDSLFRTTATAPAAPADTTAAASGGTPAAGATAVTGEAGRIFAAGLESGALPADDVHYLGQMVAQRTGLSQADAEKRVTDDFARMKAKADQAATAARDAADKARKASAYAALWLFVSLLAGAFVASLAATFGGRQRDLV